MDKVHKCRKLYFVIQTALNMTLIKLNLQNIPNICSYIKNILKISDASYYKYLHLILMRTYRSSAVKSGSVRRNFI